MLVVATSYTRIVGVRELALRLLRHPYLLGAKLGALTVLPPPDAPMDCSGFIHTLVASRVMLDGCPFPLGGGLEFIEHNGATLPISRWHGSWVQAQWVREISVAAGLDNVGCLLFRRPDPNTGHGHVGLSLGRGFTIEATSSKGGMVTILRPSEQAGRWHGGGKIDALWERIPC